ncbi:serine protease 42-like [Copidosoma floridanum]|uniref:serine protease 42-like n=1 Tax=Copidosoma floridanum TaxID=29053 RepID=UPI0006C966E0|nr:serine protease 42-like [Copidosoma floridanum]
MWQKSGARSVLLLLALGWTVPQRGSAQTSPSPLNPNLVDKVFQSPNGIGNGVVLENTPGRLGEGDCECVPYYQCQNHTIIDDGVGLIDIRLSGPCEDYLDVCCQGPDIKPPEEKITPRPQVRRGCGRRNLNGVGFKITGAKDGEAQFGEFPWMVAILQEEPIGNQGELVNVYQCGGALIHPSVVLTAAHCVHGKQASSLKVRAGEWDTQTKNEVFPHQDRQVAEYVTNDLYHSGSLRNDFALLRLAQPVNAAENIDTVCLPELGANFDYQRCFASGWGKDVFGKEGRYQVILKRVELPIVPHTACQNSLRGTRLGRYFKLHESFICAGGESGRDTCRGDGGSPLVCPIVNDPDNRYYQTGIVAWGIGCGENLVPGVYANVAYARAWIDQIMAGRWNYGTDDYQYR